MWAMMETVTVELLERNMYSVTGAAARPTGELAVITSWED